MKHRHFPRYNDDADFTTNAPSYYEDLARKEKLIRLLAERIWGYEEILDETLEEIQERFRAWDKNLEDFPEDVKVLLQKWLDDGTLDHIINDTIFNWKLDTAIFEQFRDSITAQLQQTEQELNAQLAQTVKVGTEKLFTPEMQGSFFLLGRQTPKDQVDKYKAMGFDGAVLTLHIDGNDSCDVREDMNVVYDLLAYAKEKGLKTNVCKFHAQASRVDLSKTTVQHAYVSQVMSILTALQPYGIDTVYLFNEFGDLFRSQTAFCINTINLIKSLGYKVGVTFQYNENRNSPSFHLDSLMLDIPQLFFTVDIIGLNVYPTITNDWKNATRNDSVQAWSQIYPVMEQMKETFKKPIIFTEVGCYYYYQFLVNPASFEPNILDPQLPDEEVTRIFWYGLLNDKRIQSLVDGVYSWFLDQIEEPETIGFFKHYNERV